MATNRSLKEHIKARRAAVNGFLNIPVEQVNDVQALDAAEAKGMSDSLLISDKERLTYKLGFKAYIQLALRTGQYKMINVIEVYEGELKLWNPVTEDLILDISGRQSNKVTGYVGYFELLSGFKKCVYWPKKKLEMHKKPNQGDADYKKIVVKDMLAKWGILNLDMQSAYSPELKEEVLLNKPLLKEEEIYSLDSEKDELLKA